jgi:hypothetical protein
VIASDWSGYRESVVHEQTGFLVPAYWGAPAAEVLSPSAAMRGDATTHWLLAQSVFMDHRALSTYLKTLNENADLRQRMGARGRQRALSYYDWSVVVGQYEELWSELFTLAHQVKQHNLAFSHGLNSYDYLKLFGHYATGTVSDKELLRITKIGRRFLMSELQIEPLTHNVPPFAGQLGYAIVSACGEEEEIGLGALVKKVQQAYPARAEIILPNIIRLIKYGLLECVV